MTWHRNLFIVTPMTEAEDTNPAFDASDEKQVAKAKSNAGRRAKALKDVVSSIMSTQAGRMWVWAVLTDCKVFDRSFTGEALTSAFNEGARSVGTGLMKQIEPASLALMMKEANE